MRSKETIQQQLERRAVLTFARKGYNRIGRATALYIKQEEEEDEGKTEDGKRKLLYHYLLNIKVH